MSEIVTDRQFPLPSSRSSPSVRKIGLTAHIVSSVSWLGAVIAFLVLSIAGMRSHESETVRTCYLAMNLIGEFALVPLSLATLATGLLQCLTTEWGLFKYYWVLVKFGLTLGATTLLLLHQFTAVAEAARRVSGVASAALPPLGGLGAQLVIDSCLAIIVLTGIAALSVFKPWGQTPFGTARQPTGEKPSLRLKVIVILIGLAIATLVFGHLASGHFRHHGG